MIVRPNILKQIQPKSYNDKSKLITKTHIQHCSHGRISSGVWDEDVDPTELLDRLLDQPLAVLRLADVTRQTFNPEMTNSNFKF